MERLKTRIIRILWPEIENYYASKTYSKKYLTKEDIEINDLEYWSNVKLE